MADVPHISVLMPAYNARQFIRESLDSVLAQTFTDFECIVINDGSTDDTAEILQEYSWREPRLRVLSEPNQGVSTALNRGLSLARGEFIARMDSDDICLPQRFERQAKFLQEHPDYVLVGSRCMLIDPDGFPICEKTDIALDHDEIDLLLLKMSWPLVHPAVMMRTDALRRVGGYDARYRTNQDHDLFLRLGEIGKLANLPEILLKYRQHFNSVGATKLASQTGTVLDIVKAAHRRRGLPFQDAAVGPQTMLTATDHQRNWWWWSLQAGNYSTSRRHAWAMFRNAPWSKDAWRAVYCAMRGH